jgi:hypothetical protein
LLDDLGVEMKKIKLFAACAAIVLTLAGCSNALESVSYAAGKTYGSALTQEQIDILANGDVDAFCEYNANSVDEAGTYSDFNPDEFTRGCIDGFNEKN